MHLLLAITIACQILITSAKHVTCMGQFENDLTSNTATLGKANISQTFVGNMSNYHQASIDMAQPSPSIITKTITHMHYHTITSHIPQPAITSYVHNTNVTPTLTYYNHEPTTTTLTPTSSNLNASSKNEWHDFCDAYATFAEWACPFLLLFVVLLGTLCYRSGLVQISQRAHWERAQNAVEHAFDVDINLIKKASDWELEAWLKTSDALKNKSRAAEAARFAMLEQQLTEQIALANDLQQRLYRALDETKITYVVEPEPSSTQVENLRQTLNNLRTLCEVERKKARDCRDAVAARDKEVRKSAQEAFNLRAENSQLWEKIDELKREVRTEQQNNLEMFIEHQEEVCALSAEHERVLVEERERSFADKAFLLDTIEEQNQEIMRIGRYWDAEHWYGKPRAAEM